MQKSAHTNKLPARPPVHRFDSVTEKGQKFEPFWTAAGQCETRSRARLLKADQKR